MLTGRSRADRKAKHPEATAISSGAILSNYQRLRIEHVCQRLGLTSLAYLWQSEQLPLVTRMVSSGLEAVLVKVAGIGLGQRQVGKSLGQLLPLLTRLVSCHCRLHSSSQQLQFGAHPAGEGGEYETLTLDCPLFSSRINIVESEIIETEPEPFSVAYLRIIKAVLEPKRNWVRPTVSQLRELLELDSSEEGQEGLDEGGLDVLECVGAVSSVTDDLPALVERLGSMQITPPDDPRRHINFGRRGRAFAVSAESHSAGGMPVGDELSAAFDAIGGKYGHHSLTDVSSIERRRIVFVAPLDSYHPSFDIDGSVPCGQRRLRQVLWNLSAVACHSCGTSARRAASTS